jgi:hypothetical protein
VCSKRPDIRRADAERLVRHVAGGAAASIGAEAAEEGVARVGAAINVKCAKNPRRIGKALQARLVVVARIRQSRATQGCREHHKAQAEFIFHDGFAP